MKVEGQPNAGLHWVVLGMGKTKGFIMRERAVKAQESSSRAESSTEDIVVDDVAESDTPELVHIAESPHDGPEVDGDNNVVEDDESLGSSNTDVEEEDEEEDDECMVVLVEATNTDNDDDDWINSHNRSASSPEPAENHDLAYEPAQWKDPRKKRWHCVSDRTSHLARNLDRTLEP